MVRSENFVPQSIFIINLILRAVQIANSSKSFIKFENPH